MILTRGRLVLLAIVVGSIGFAAMFVAITAGGSTHDIELAGVDGDKLAAFDVKLLEPEGEPAIGAAEAESAAKGFGGTAEAKVKEAVLVRLVRTTAHPPVDTLAWALNYDPKTVSTFISGPGSPDGFQPRPCTGPPTFHIAFVDATTGRFIMAVEQPGEEIQCNDPDGPTPTAAPTEPA